MEEKFCQSCGMPLTAEQYGTNADGSPNADYCSYCYDAGAFTMEFDMEGMIAFSLPYVMEANPAMSEGEARAMLTDFYPTLKRWKAKE